MLQYLAYIYYVFSARCNCQVMIEVLCAELNELSR